MDDERIEMEARMAWLENYVRELDDVVREMAAELDKLRGEVKELRERRALSADAEAETTTYEKPPHY